MPRPESLTDDCLAGGGEMGALMRSIDWAKTPIGPVASWSPALRTMVRVLLVNRFQLFLWWGPQYVQIYNDASRPILGAKHPRSMGQPAAECWSEIWHVIGPLIDSPFRGGPATWMEDIFLEINRYGTPEETHFTIAYSPVPDETVPSGIGGVFATVHEITGKVVGERRVVVLRDLGAQAVDAKTDKEACATAAKTLAAHDKDVPFALIYLLDAEAEHAELAAMCGVTGGEAISPRVVRLEVEGRAGWPLAEVVEANSLRVVSDLAARFGSVPPGPWSDLPTTAVVLPIPSTRAHLPAGLLVAGVSARLRLDEQYRGFLELVAGQIGNAVANARAYEEEKRRAEVLAELDRAKTAFFSNVSHEFRTPLTLMLGPVEDALADTAEPLPAIQRERLETAHRSSLRLLKLVNTLLDFARIEAGRVQAVYEPTDLAALTAELASNFRSACEKAGLRLVVDCPPLREPVYVDRDMWEKVVLNLLSNAFKFTFEGEIAVRLRAVGDAVQLSVHDTGTGIPAAELPRIFERFHRVEAARGRTHEGTGIGLALVQELVKLHGGAVGVESIYGQGSAFTVSVPTGTAHLPADRIGAACTLGSTAVGAGAFIEEALRWLGDDETSRSFPGSVGNAREAFPPVGTPGEEGDAGPRPRILWADDNADMRDYVRRLLAPRYDVEAVPDGEAALAAARARPPDLVLSDVMMPRLDGFGLLAALRADPRTSTTPVILLSARAGEESRVEGLQAGADDYLIKPFSARELLARVGANVEMARVRRESERRVTRILESISDGFIALDRDWRYTALNDRAAESMGMSRDDVLGRRIWELYPDTVGTRFEAELYRAVAEQKTVVFEYFYPTRNLWYENRVHPSADGVSIFFADVTDRKRGEEALRASEARLDLAMRGSNIGIWDLDLAPGGDYRRDPVRFINVWEPLGYDPAEFPADAVASRTLGHPDDLARVDAAVAACLAGETEEIRVENRIRHKDGSYRWLLTIGRPTRDEAGTPVRLIGTVLDITTRKRAEEVLRESEARMAADLAAMTQLQKVSTRLVRDGDSHPLLLEIVDAAIAITAADMGNIQLYDPASGTLRIVAARGFQPEDLRTFGIVRPGQATCGTALVEGKRVVVGDVTTSPIFVGQPILGAMLGAGIRAAQSTPLIGRSGRLVGMLSTHYRIPRRPAERDLHILDLLARQAADWIERAQADQALRESEERFRRYFELGLIGMAITSPSKGCIEVNDEMCKILGYQRDELLTRTWAEMTHPEDVAADLAQFNRVMAGESDGYTMGKRWIRKDGGVIHSVISVKCVRLADGSVDYFVGLLQDVTERQRAEEVLRASEERFRGTFENAAVGIAHVDAECRFLRVNETLCVMLGYTRDELLCMTCLDVTHPEDVAANSARIQSLLRGESPSYSLEKRYLRKDGSAIWVDLSVSLQRDEAGRPAYAIEITEVISERKRLEAELRQAKEVAEAANRAKDEFLANVSHEIRTPFGAILGLTELVLDTPLSEDQRQSLATVKSAADNLLGVVDDLLDFSKIEAGKLELDPAHFSLRSTLGDTLRALAVRAHKKGLELVWSAGPDVPDALVGDAVRLRQVLLNLVGNAVKFTASGEVAVTVGRLQTSERGSQMAEGKTGGDEQSPSPAAKMPSEICDLQFAVRDTGIGIPPDGQARIFQAFEQQDVSTTRKYGGTGLGLTIAARLTELMGGRITLQSEPGQGSTFTFTARFVSPPAPEQPSRPPADLHDLPALVVDDNATSRHLLTEWLGAWRMKPTAAADAAAAWDALSSAAALGRPYALALLDESMPGTSGLALAARIRQSDALRSPRIILLTSGDRPGDSARSRELGIDAVLLKPVGQEELLVAIRRVMSRPPGEAAPARPAEPPAVAPLRILVAEDNEFNVAHLERVLSWRGHRVWLASDGREALGFLGIGGGGDPEATAEFDLLLLDLHMPVLDGFAVIEAVRARERVVGGHLPVIALTARSRKEDRERCLAAGVDAFLSKPVRMAELFAAIDAAVLAGTRGAGAGGGAASADKDLLDPAALLAACGGDAEALRDLCRDFETYAPGRLTAAGDAQRDGDAGRLREAAHKLCGLLSAFSTTAGGLASDLEDEAAAGRLEQTGPLVRRVAAMVEGLLRQVLSLSLDDLTRAVGGPGGRKQEGGG